METEAVVPRRTLPRGWRDLLRQLVIWFGFLFAYQIVRGLADRNPTKAFENGYRVFELEQRLTHNVWELTAQRVADSSGWLLTAAQWTYWNSEFTVVGLALRHGDGEPLLARLPRRHRRGRDRARDRAARHDRPRPAHGQRELEPTHRKPAMIFIARLL